MLLFNPILITHHQPAILNSPKKRKTKLNSRKINAFGILQLDKIAHILKNEFETLDRLCLVVVESNFKFWGKKPSSLFNYGKRLT